MKRAALVALTLVLVVVAFSAGAWWTSRGRVVSSAASPVNAAAHYTCPMHPQYTSDHPGDCPICGMRLESAAAEQGNSRSKTAIPGLVAVGATGQQLIGVRTDEVSLGSSSHVLRVPGRIAVDDQRLYRIVTSADGWILDLRENTVGRFVKKDQLLATYYTNDLLATERLFLLSIPANEPLPTQARDFSQASIRTAGSANPQYPIDSLRGLGMSDLQIREIHRTRTASPHVDIYSPVSGFVLARNISPGQRFDKGTELYRVADLSRVWVLTDVFEKDREFLKPGAEATVIYQGRQLKARMSDSLPQFDADSRTLQMRFELNNPGYLLQPAMFVDVELKVETPPAITVPADALFDSGLRKTVFVDRGNGNFEARRVETGWRLGGRVEIVRGLMEGERVAAAANFLLDSESRMKAVSAGIFDPEVDPVCGMEVDGKKASASGRTARHDGRTYYFCADDCRKKFEAEPGRYVAAHHDGPAPTGQERGQKTAKGMAPAAVGKVGPVKDLVCGMMVDPQEPAVAARKVDHRGRAYYFCSDECKARFAANPENYVK
jgi:membrane fusion protein, copper/silver efflux system